MSFAETYAVDPPRARPAPAVDRANAYRAGLIAAAARHLSLAPQDLATLAEAMTNRPWEQCGLGELRLVAWTLVEASRSSVGQPDRRSDPCHG
jgi:hypothetical protein